MDTCHFCKARRHYPCQSERDTLNCVHRESDWLRDAKRTLEQRDPVDALHDVERLLAWAAAHADEALDLACIDRLAPHSTTEAVEIGRRLRGLSR